MRITLRDFALLALPALSNAVSLSDMTPRAIGLPPMCEAVYTAQIYGCTPADFQTNQCSSSCINALYGIAQAIGHACGGQGVTGQNLVVAFLDGVGPQQLCHNAAPGGMQTGPPMSSPQAPQTTPSPTIGSSTTTAPKATGTASLLIDTSSTMTATVIPKPHKTQTSSSSSSSETTSKTTQTTAAAEHTQAPVASTKTSSAPGNSQTNLHDHSGGGSPFDTLGNLSAAAGLSIPMIWTLVLAIAAMLMAFQ